MADANYQEATMRSHQIQMNKSGGACVYCKNLSDPH